MENITRRSHRVKRWKVRRCSGFVVAEDPNRKVFNVRRPLSSQLEKLHIVPLDAVYRH